MQMWQMPTRPFGKTGERVGLLGMGVWVEDDERQHIEIVRRGIDEGVSFQDTSWDYHEGRSETRLGRALKGGYRERAFLMTKIDARTKRAAAEQIRQSMDRLGVEFVDLLQFHEVIRMWEPDRIFAEDGAMHAVIEARKAGLVRFVGFTGHKDPEIHLKMLDVAERHDFRFDAHQLPLNAYDPHYRSFEKAVLPRLLKEGIAVIGMKPLGGRYFLEDGGPLSKPELLAYTMSLPVSVCLSAANSMRHLEESLNATRAFTFSPPAPHDIVELRERTRLTNEDGRFERYKTTDRFDGTSRNPEWLGTPEMAA
ncbi:MAG: aldo/keto reductase [Actinobacteria bacterium]|nr:MAG: aldo/keto reductase [Actinomycetota bacterium]